MECPRCGCNTPAEKNQCRECAWTLASPFGGNGKTSGFRFVETPDDIAPVNEEAFSPEDYLEPPKQPALWTGRLSRTLPRGWRKKSRRDPVERLGNTAVATVPEEARWASPQQIEYIQMPLVQSRFDFSAPDDGAQLAAHFNASLRTRFLAGMIDTAIIAKALAIFIGLFALLNGGLSLARKDLLLYLIAGFSISSAYFIFFTLTMAATPGMQLRGLRVLTFEGKPPGFHHRLWRSFGYVVSAGAVMLGFLWPAVDEKRLTWHDYISGTFLTDRENL